MRVRMRVLELGQSRTHSYVGKDTSSGVGAERAQKGYVCKDASSGVRVSFASHAWPPTPLESW